MDQTGGKRPAMACTSHAACPDMHLHPGRQGPCENSLARPRHIWLRGFHTGSAPWKRVAPCGCRAAWPPVLGHPGGREAQRGGTVHNGRQLATSHTSTSSYGGWCWLCSIGRRTWLCGRVQSKAAAAATAAASGQRGTRRRSGVGGGAGVADEARVRRRNVTAQQVQVGGEA